MSFFINEHGLPTCCGKRLLRPSAPYCGLCLAHYDRKLILQAMSESPKFSKQLDRQREKKKLKRLMGKDPDVAV